MTTLACVRGVLKGSTALSDGELEKIIKDYKAKKAADARAAAEPAAARAAALREAEAHRYAAALERANARRNAVIHRGLLDEQGKYDDMAQWIEAQIAGSNKRVEGARDSVNAKQLAYQGKYLGGLVHDLRKANLLQYVQARLRDLPGELLGFRDGKGPLDDKIATELWEKREGGKPGSTGSAEARAIADIIYKYQELARKDQNNLGANIRKIPGYIVAQSHDMVRINAAGFEAWSKFIRPLLDEAQTFKDIDFDLNQTILGQRYSVADEARIRQFLERAYVQLSQGEFYRAQSADAPLLGFKGPGNLAKKVSQSRSIHFKDAASWIAYNDEFGTGNLMEAVSGGLHRASRNAALMEKFGTNPRAMFDRVLADAREAALRRGEKIDSRLSMNGFTSRLFSVADGSVDIPASVSVAQISSFARAWESLSKLGGAVLSSLPDIATAASELNYQGKSFFSSLGDQIHGMAAQFGDEGLRKEFAEYLGMGIDTIVNDIAGRVTGTDVGTWSAIHKLSGAQMKLNLLSGFTNAGERSLSHLMARQLYNERGLTHGKLSPERQRVLGLYGIGPAEWDVIRQNTEYRVRDEGTELLAPDKLRDMPLDKIDPLIQWPLMDMQRLAAEGLARMQKRGASLERRLDALTEQLGAQGELGETIAAIRAAREQTRALLADDKMASRWSLEQREAGPDQIHREASRIATEHERTLQGFRTLVADAVEKLKLSKKAEPGVLSKLAQIEHALSETRDIIADWPASLERQITRRREEAVQALETKLRGYYADRVTTGVLRGGIREKAYTTQGAQAGTTYGEAVRFVMQFKQYPLAFIQKVLGRFAQTDRFWQIPAGLLNMPAAEAQQLAALFVTMTALGYIGMAAKDIAKGRTPRDPRDPRTVGAAMLQGGGMGLYGDFLFQRTNRFGGGFLETAAGPVLGTGADIVDLALKARDYALGAGEYAAGVSSKTPDAPDVEFFNLFKNNTPFMNLFYTRAALDYLIMYDFQEMLSPGSLRRMERRLKDQQGQEFILPPSEVRARPITH